MIDNFHNIVKEKLYIGLSIKNYKEICSLLSQEQKTSGKGRTHQANYWKQYFDYEKQGHKYIITAIHDEPIPMTENNNIYGKYIEKLILDLLVQKYQSKNIHSNRRLYLSKDSMLQALNMVNSNYHYVKFNTGKTADFIKVDKESLKEFYNINNKNLTDAVDRALNRLSNRFLVIWNLVHTIALNEEVTIYNNEGQKITLKENHVTAGKVELEYINTYEKLVAEQMEFKSKQEIYLCGKYKEFIKNVCEQLQKQGLNILYYYRSYDIIFHPDVIKERDKLNEFLLEYEERQNVKITLNGIVSKQIIINADNRQKEAKGKLKPVFGKRNTMNQDYEEQKNVRRSQLKYITDTSKIIDTIINYKTKDISSNILDYERMKRKRFNKKMDDILK